MKYEFTGVTKVMMGIVLKQIIRKADKLLGGYIEKGSNLSQTGDAEVSGNARVYGDAQVCGDAQVFSRADLIFVLLPPYSITITPQNIVIGCTLKSRFGKDQWSVRSKGATPELIVAY